MGFFFCVILVLIEKFRYLSNVFIRKDYPDKICCANCKKEIGIMDLQTKTVDVLSCRLMKLTPIEFRLQCKYANIDHHDHEYQTILRLTDEKTKIIIPVRFSYFNYRGEKMQKMCVYMSKKKSAFFQEVSVNVQKKCVKKSSKVDKSLFDFIRKDLTEDKYVVEKEEKIKGYDNIMENILFNALKVNPKNYALRDHDYENVNKNAENSEPVPGTSKFFYDNPKKIDEFEKNEKVRIIESIVLNLENETQNMIVGATDQYANQNISTIDSVMNDCYSDITVDDVDWDMINEICFNGNMHPIDVENMDQINNNYVVQNDVMLTEAIVNHENPELIQNVTVDDLQNVNLESLENVPNVNVVEDGGLPTLFDSIDSENQMID